MIALPLPLTFLRFNFFTIQFLRFHFLTFLRFSFYVSFFYESFLRSFFFTNHFYFVQLFYESFLRSTFLRTVFTIQLFRSVVSNAGTCGRYDIDFFTSPRFTPGSSLATRTRCIPWFSPPFTPEMLLCRQSQCDSACGLGSSLTLLYRHVPSSWTFDWKWPRPQRVRRIRDAEIRQVLWSVFKWVRSPLGD